MPYSLANSSPDLNSLEIAVEFSHTLTYRIASGEVRLMFQTTVSRGRPKGTGIDDSERIARLFELLRAYPELKPTTAIRVMGITDPSAIRRIRDKFRHGQAPDQNNAAARIPAGAQRASGPVPVAVKALASVA